MSSYLALRSTSFAWLWTVDTVVKGNWLVGRESDGESAATPSDSGSEQRVPAGGGGGEASFQLVQMIHMKKCIKDENLWPAVSFINMFTPQETD